MRLIPFSLPSTRRVQWRDEPIPRKSNGIEATWEFIPSISESNKEIKGNPRERFANKLISIFFFLFTHGDAGLGGGESEDGDTKDKDDEAERERLEAIKEAEDRRKEKHRKMEEEREKMRQDIRDKVQ